MTMTLDPDDRPTPRVANLAARTGHGSVYYAPEFWQHANAHPIEGRDRGSIPPRPVRGAASGPASPLVDRLAPYRDIVVGLALTALFYFGIRELSRAVWP